MMKKIVFILCFLVLKTILVAQTPAARYAAFIKKADTFYRVKNYKTSGQTYTQAFKFNHWKIPQSDGFNAACSWTLADQADSAFAYLDIIATAGYSKYDQLTTDHDLQSLHRDKRWKKLLAVVTDNKAKEEAKLNKPLIAELDTILDHDQKYRAKINDTKQNYGADSKEMKALWRTINENDSIDLLKVKTILDRDGWLGPDVVGEEGSETLFLVIQHSDQKTQEKYLPMVREAVEDGRASAGMLALLEDRVAVKQGKKQIYGSQIVTDPKTGKDTIAPVEDFANVNKRRAAIGLEPLEEYVKQWNIVLKKAPEKRLIPNGIANSDFSTAMEIHDSIIDLQNVTTGFGKQLDYAFGNGCKRETNSAWYKITVPYDTIITFDLVPNDPKDDYDFIFFKCPDKTCIDGISSCKVGPDRFCFSINFDKSASTGLSLYSNETALNCGPGDGYVAGLPVKAGETCYLMVNFPEFYHRTSKGFTLYFYNYWPQKPERLKSKPSARSKVIPAKKTIVLENVLFVSDKTVLLKESNAALDKLVSFLQSNKNMKIEIRGHTDNTGDEKKNQKLSEGRAKAIVDYLVSKKIDKSRLSYKGFGSTQPIASNDNDEGKQKNRRVEFIILPN
ncbi:MAG: hypothetical protein JWP12_2689 [Bacteroidetes bacterium]|nr:hypothetical protein [Bacteroidota bacterium]